MVRGKRLAGHTASDAISGVPFFLFSPGCSIDGCSYMHRLSTHAINVV